MGGFQEPGFFRTADSVGSANVGCVGSANVGCRFVLMDKDVMDEYCERHSAEWSECNLNGHRTVNGAAITARAAQRDKRPDKGGLTKDSILWRLMYQCGGGAGCTPRPGRSTGCELEVHCTATADQILNGDYVRVRLIKQHCADGSWVPPQPGPDPAKQAELTQALPAVQELRVEKGVCEARIARGGAMSAAAGAMSAAAGAG